MEGDINYWSAVGFCLIGWVVQCTWFYFEYDTDKKINWTKFWRHYDRYIIFGFVGAVALAFISDLVWTYVISGMLGMDGVPYEERVNILLGILVIPTLRRWKKIKG